MTEIGRPPPHHATHDDGGSDEINPYRDVTVLSVGTDTTLTAAQVEGALILVTATATITLPPVIIGATVTIYSTTAAAVMVDPNANDRIVLDGIAGGNGKKITSASAAGDFATLIGDSGDGWTVIGRSGTWTLES
jgi:hypothetical protein